MDEDNVVTKPSFEPAQHDGLGKVYINDVQYFENVPEVACNFYIGGYLPAQKLRFNWLLKHSATHHVRCTITGK